MVSVTEPIGSAFEWMKRVLFRPFDLSRWFVLGFSAFLAGLGERGGSFNFPSNSSGGRGGGGGTGFAEAKQFVLEYLVVIIAITIGAAVLVLALSALVTWLSSRGKFMFLDNVVRNRAEVREPWARFRHLGNNLFVFRFVLIACIWMLTLLVLAALAALAWPDISSERLSARGISAIAVAATYFLTIGLGFLVFNAVLKDFAVPVMYLRNVRTTAALGVFFRELLPGHVGAFVLFYLMKILLVMAAGMIALVAVCLTCCVAALPYLSSVVMLPITVFFQGYNLFFLEQFGPEWRFFDVYDPFAAPPQNPYQGQPWPQGPAPTHPGPDPRWPIAGRG